MTDQPRYPILPPEYPYTPDDEIDLFELVAGLWRARVLIVAITTAVTTLSMLYALVATPVYESIAKLRPQSVSALASIAIEDLISLGPQSAFDRTLLELQSTTLQDRAARDALGDEQVVKIEDIFSIDYDTESRITNGTQTERYTFLTVTGRHSDPDTSAELTNNLIQLATRAVRAEVVDDLHSRAAARLDRLEEDINRRLEAAKRDADIRITQLEETDVIAREKLEDRIRELRKTSRKLRDDQLVQLREALDIANKLEINEPRGKDFQNVVNIDTAKRTARADRAASLPLYALGTFWLQSEIGALEAREGDDHDTPQIRVLEQQLAELAVNQEIEALRAREDFTPFVPGISDSLTQKAKLEATLQASFPDLRVVRLDQAPLPPESPVAPRRALIVVLGVMLGGMLGVFVALIMNAVQARRPVESDPA